MASEIVYRDPQPVSKKTPPFFVAKYDGVEIHNDRYNLPRGLSIAYKMTCSHREVRDEIYLFRAPSFDVCSKEEAVEAIKTILKVAEVKITHLAFLDNDVVWATTDQKMTPDPEYLKPMDDLSGLHYIRCDSTTEQIARTFDMGKFDHCRVEIIELDRVRILVLEKTRYVEIMEEIVKLYGLQDRVEFFMYPFNSHRFGVFDRRADYVELDYPSTNGSYTVMWGDGGCGSVSHPHSSRIPYDGKLEDWQCATCQEEISKRRRKIGKILGHRGMKVWYHHWGVFNNDGTLPFPMSYLKTYERIHRDKTC